MQYVLCSLGKLLMTIYALSPISDVLGRRYIGCNIARLNTVPLHALST